MSELVTQVAENVLDYLDDEEATPHRVAEALRRMGYSMNDAAVLEVYNEVAAMQQESPVAASRFTEGLVETASTPESTFFSHPSGFYRISNVRGRRAVSIWAHGTGWVYIVQVPDEWGADDKEAIYGAGVIIGTARRK